ncbi:MAG: hypothetical protein GY832_31750 [Chloroflexi bacterium]|nr:hypothetical protein [Chloroflexota bacterium]
MSRKEVLHRYNNSEKGKAAQRKYRRTTAGKALSRRAKIKYYYGLKSEEYEVMLSQQHGVCGICGKPPTKQRVSLDVDHDHETGKIRGLLCNVCNRHLGRVEAGWNYKGEWGLQMVDYLRRNRSCGF